MREGRWLHEDGDLARRRVSLLDLHLHALHASVPLLDNVGNKPIPSRINIRRVARCNGVTACRGSRFG